MLFHGAHTNEIRVCP